MASLRERGAGVVQHRADVAGALGRVLRLGLRELGVHDRDEDALAIGVVDQRVERVVARVTHDRDAVGLGRDRLAGTG